MQRRGDQGTSAEVLGDDGIPCVPFVPFRCPTCGRSKPFTSNVRGRLRMHRCKACQQKYRSLELGADAVMEGWAEALGFVQTSARTRVLPNPAHPQARRDGSTRLQRRELAAADELLPEDVADAARVLKGWRVRLAVMRSEKRMASDEAPLAEDLELLERVVTRTGGACLGVRPAPSPPASA